MPSRDPVEAQEIIDVLSKTFRKWQLPALEDIHFVESLPKTSVGKLDKKVMRKMLAGSVTIAAAGLTRLTTIVLGC